MLCVLCPLCGFLALPNHIPSKASFPLETSSPIENKLKKCKDYTTTGHCQPFTSPHLLTSPIQNLFPLHLGHVHPPRPPLSLQLITRLHTCQAPWPACSRTVLGGSWEKKGDQRVTFCGGNGLSKELNQHRWVAPLPLSARNTLDSTEHVFLRCLEWGNCETFWSNCHTFFQTSLVTGFQNIRWRRVGLPVENTRRQTIWGYWQESYRAMSAKGSILWI